MDVFSDFLARIDHPQHRARAAEVLAWVAKTFAHLEPRIAWNQPVFVDHGTFIVGFSVARKHLAAAPERVGIERFAAEIVRAGYGHSQELVRIPWDGEVNYELLEQMIAFNIHDKADCPTFWRQRK